ncbi:hypothetical protein CAPTEDRAFT_225564 [Capitella teleta]|uniref:O-acyltransferase n=1 Tax=Capitella teleta TaxID=283909 RepID=R7U2P3_CAPTE|nr:hypothetical protein CAPTEDRAFT_225564 [Capitella teleta]|eukprot:ELU00615.1 hypothetical protein CAPTEDRAFT_225564 [Capitella teleta]
MADEVSPGKGDGLKSAEAESVSQVVKDVNLQKIRDKALSLKSELLDNIESRLGDLIEDFVHEVEKIEQAPSLNGAASILRTDFNYNNSNVIRRRKNGELHEKEFIARRSVLTELLEISHIRTIYHIFVAILIVFTLNTLVFDMVDKGGLVLGFELIRFTFGDLPSVMWLWCCMQFSVTLVVYPLFHYWSNNRQSGPVYWADYVWLAGYVVYQILFLVLPIQTLNAADLPPGSSVIIVCEQVRFVMKQHAFIRENIPRALKLSKAKKEDPDEETPCPNFSSYLYFLFAPTLVYRDTYPRTPGPVRWSYVFSNFAQVVACLFFSYYIFERFCVPVFRNFNEEYWSPRRLILSMFGSILPGTLVLFIGFFAILHSWLNAFAEMLRFADRLFYKDWWNSSSFANYYRTWNVVVHDWLYNYIYKDIYRLLGANYRPVAMASVFGLSAVFHEYILTVTFKFFYPVLFLMFGGAGFGFIFLPSKAKRSGNVFMWVALFTGNGMLMCLYSMEWYARQRCPPVSDNFIFDYLTPRSWFCELSNVTGV